MEDRSRVTAASLDHLYQELLDQISGTDSFAYDISMRAFSWLICMHEPLSPTAFLAAVSSSGSEDRPGLTLPDLFSICSNLIVLDSKRDTIRFVHSSFKEFLEARPEFDIARAHGVAAMSCLESCIQEIPTDLEGDLRPDKEFKVYAALYWPNHCSAATNDEAQGSSLSMKLNDFVFCNDKTSLPFLSWLDTAQRASDLMANDHVLKKQLNAVKSPSMTPLFTACVYGLINLFEIVVKRQGFEVDMKNSHGHTGLYLAAEFGRPKIVDGFLQLGANIHSQGGILGNSLNAAAFNGHAAVVQLFLHHGADMQSPSILETALDLAFLGGHQDIAMMFFQNDVGISCQDDYDKFHDAASQAGFYELLLYLTKAFPSFSQANSSSSEIVNTSISKGRLSFLRTYIKKGLLVDHPVATAALFGQTEIALLFLQEGFDIEEEGPFGSPLQAACLMGHQSTSRMLLEQGANVNARGKFGDGLQAASMKGHLSIISLLIQHNADVNNTGGYYGTALQAAAHCGHYAVAKVLIEAGSSMIRSGRFKDAFHAAAEAGQETIINLFIQKGYSFQDSLGVMACSYPTYRHKNLLSEALNVSSSADSELSSAVPLSEFQDIFKRARGVVVSADPPPPPYNLKEIYPSHYFEESEAGALVSAAARGEERIVHAILENSKDLSLSLSEIGEALWAASKNGHTTVVKLTMSSWADMLSYIPGSVKHAAWHGHITTLEAILQCEETWGPVSSSFFESYWADEGHQETFDLRRLFKAFYVSPCNYLLPVDDFLSDWT